MLHLVSISQQHNMSETYISTLMRHCLSEEACRPISTKGNITRTAHPNQSL